MSDRSDVLDRPAPAARVTWPDAVAPAAEPALDAARAGTASPAAHDAGAAALLLRILDQLDYGLMLVGEQARLRFANRVAQRECGAARCVSLHDGQVHPRQERDRQRFQKALDAARAGRRSMLTLRANDASLSVAVVPLAGPLAAAGAPATLLVFGRPRVCEPLSVEFFAQEHGLTSAEGGVLRGLCSGLRPANIARQAGVAVSTVRTQIGNIRLKTGATSIAELVRMVTVLPPIITLLN